MKNLIAVRGSVSIQFKEWTFPGGELGLKLDSDQLNYKFGSTPYQTIFARLRSAEDVVRLALLKDALTRFAGVPVRLVMPYVPYARQDRVCDAGESFSLMPFSKLVRSMGFEHVTVFDPHSAVTEAALEPDRIVSQFDIINMFPDLLNRIRSSGCVVAPDASAAKKLLPVVRMFDGSVSLVAAEKVRDTKTGAIASTKIDAESVRGKDVVMIDDICDGGRTFTELATVLKSHGAGAISLYVTHGLFSRGLQPLFDAGITEIFTTDTILPESLMQNPPDNLRIFNAVNFFTCYQT